MEPALNSTRPVFLKYHCNSVRGVAFHPKERYLFASGGYDGKVNLCSAKDGRLHYSVSIRSLNLAKNVNAVRFTSDGSRMVTTSTSKRLTVIDTATGIQLHAYENSTFSGRDRAALATDPASPNTVVCTCVNGKGLSIFDLRTPLPLDIFHDLQNSIIRDVTFLHSSWPWCLGQRSLLCVSAVGIVKVLTLDSGRVLNSMDAGQSLNSVTSTSNSYDFTLEDGYESLITLGGEFVATYAPGKGVQEELRHNGDSTLWKIRYTSSGGTMYSGGEDGIVRCYRRTTPGGSHEYRGELFGHMADVQDMDVSAYDEYLVSASRDKTVGICKIGPPNHGSTEYYELA